MCGRYTLTVDQEALSAALGVELLLSDHPAPRYNIAPTQEAPVLVRERSEGHEGNEDREGYEATVRRLRWGLVPSWSDDSSRGARLINARSETVAMKPSFREAFRSGRCLVPADGYYEWFRPKDDSAGGTGKIPWWIHAPGREVFTFGGLRARWTPPGGGPALETFTILTCDAVGDVARLHHRMPVVIPADLRDAWMQNGEEGGDFDMAPLLEGARRAARSLDAYPVSTRVNRPANDDPALVDEVDPAVPVGEENLPPEGEAPTAPPAQTSLF